MKVLRDNFFSKRNVIRINSETKALLTLVFPIIISQISTTSMGFVDTFMAGRVGSVDLAAVGIGNSIWVPVYLMISGTLLAITSKVAKYCGAKSYEEIGPLIRQGLWLALFIGIIGSLSLICAKPILQWMDVSPEIITPCIGYLRGIAFGIPAVGLYSVLRGFSDGLGKTKPSMLLGISALMLNIPFNYVFIYGKFGIPAMGGVGCGWASSIVMWFMAFSMLIWTYKGSVYKSSQVYTSFQGPILVHMRSLLKIGLPIGIAIFAESSIFCIIALLLGSLGAIVVSGHQIALNFSSIVYMIPYSLGMGVMVRVSQALGRGNPVDARFSTFIGLTIALMWAILASVFIFFFRVPIASIYTTNKEVLRIAAELLIFAGIYQYSDVVQVITAAALRGYEDTKAAMLMTLFSYWVLGLPIGYALGLTNWLGEASGPSGLWQGLIISLTCAAFMLLLRLNQISKRGIKIAAISK